MYYPDEDPLAPARGAVYGLLLAVAIWLAIGGAAVAAWWLL